MDVENLITHRLYRQHVTVVDQVHIIKDLSNLGRDLGRTIILDNTQSNYAYQPENGLNIKSWFDDRADRELARLIPLLKYVAQSSCEDVRPWLPQIAAIIEQ